MLLFRSLSSEVHLEVSCVVVRVEVGLLVHGVDVRAQKRAIQWLLVMMPRGLDVVRDEATWAVKPEAASSELEAWGNPKWRTEWTLRMRWRMVA